MLTHQWIKELKVGDVVRMRSGRLRIVRSVSHSGKRGGLTGTHVCFTIARPSWTTRPYTWLIGNDLVYAGYRPTGATAKLGRHKFDADMELSMRCESAEQCPLRAKDVIGLP